VLNAVIEQFGQQTCWTTRELALAMGASEHKIRAAVSWLVLGKLIGRAGSVQRYDHKGRPYWAAQYCWTGRSTIERIPRDSGERQAVLNQLDAEVRNYWLRRKWA